MSIRIGLIDNGININNSLITEKKSIINGWKGSYNDYNDAIGHGTQCAHLILKTAEFITEIYNVKVFDKTLRTSTKNILDALQWCINNDIKLINLSLSVPDINYYYEFKQICDDAYKKGIIIVAAADNAGQPCLPAYLENVLGVGIAKLENESDFYFVNASIQLYANGNISNICIDQPAIQGTSFATARMTGRIANILLENPNINFNQLADLLFTESLTYKKEKILMKNQKINLNKYTVPVSLRQNRDVKLIIKELKDISTQHIVNNQILSIALINLSNNPDISDIEIKIKDELIKRKCKFIVINSDINSNTSDYIYSFNYYRQMQGRLQTTYAKALIETVNNNHPNAELILIRMDKSPVPLNLNSSNFFDNYTIPELSLLFGFQLDLSILIMNSSKLFSFL